MRIVGESAGNLVTVDEMSPGTFLVMLRVGDEYVLDVVVDVHSKNTTLILADGHALHVQDGSISDYLVTDHDAILSRNTDLDMDVWGDVL